jgi:Type II CAAX prenyl endopeptidase Rce1-like
LEALAQESHVDASRRTTYLWIETGTILLAYLAPLIFSSEASMYGLGGRRLPVPFVYHSLQFIVSNIGQIAFVLFIIWRSNDPLSLFGIKPFKPAKDLLGGVILCAIQLGAYRLLWWALRHFLSRYNYSLLVYSGSRLLYIRPHGSQEFALLAVMCAASGYVQELVMRAYFLVRFEELFKSTPVAFLLSTVLFIAYHGYQGSGGVIGVALFAIIQATVFCVFRRLTPVAISHAIYNFVVIGQIL